jgi:nucleotide-binding universal stress UspA family protein
MFSSLLVPLDGSSFGEHALPLALAIAERARARLHLLHVEPPLPATVYPDVPIILGEDLAVQLRAQQQAYLDGAVERVRAATLLPVTGALRAGEVALTIAAEATKVGADLVVMTTHARGPLGRFWLGSVADELVRQAPARLLLVRPEEFAADLKRRPALRQVLLPLDGTPLAEQMIEPAVALGKLLGAEFTLLRVLKPVALMPYHSPPGGSVGQRTASLIDRLQELQQQLRQQARDYLAQVAEPLHAQGLRVTTRVAVAEQPAVAILEEAESVGADLIALETHGRRGLARLFLGSVADKVVRGASVPVLVHRPTETEPLPPQRRDQEARRPAVV